MVTWADLTQLRPKVLGTSDTIQQMHRVVAKSKLDPIVVQIAHSIRLKCSGHKDFVCQAKGVFNWMRDNMVFVRHRHQIQVIEDVRAMLARMIQLKQSGVYRGTRMVLGDCPHYSIVGAALGGILGFPYAFETVIADAGRPDEFSHVYTSLYIPSQGWKAVDASTESANFDWRPPLPKDRFKVWPEPEIESVLSKADMQEAKELQMSSLNGHGMGQLHAGPFRIPPSIYPKEFFKTIPERRPGCVSFGRPRPSYIEDWFPKEPAVPSGDLEYPAPDLVKQTIPPPANARIPMDDKMLEDEQRPYYHYPESGISQHQFLYKSWPFRNQVNVDTEGQGEMLRQVSPHHHYPVPGVSRHAFDVPGQHQSYNVDLIQKEEFAMSGMGQFPQIPVMVQPTLSPEQTQAAVASAQTSVLEDIAQAAIKIGSAFGVAEANRVAFEAKAAADRAAAQLLAQRQAAYQAAGMGPAGEFPWLVVGGVAAGAGLLYFLVSQMGKRRARRVR